MKSSFKVFVIRPYHSRIREKVFGAIRSLGGIFEDEWIIEPETPDPIVLSRLRNITPDLILCPFNPHQDKMRQEVHGVGILEKISREKCIPTDVPILMPVTQLGKPRCVSMLEKANIENKERILIVEQKHYEGEDLDVLIGNHLERFNLSTSLPAYFA